jgi:predicted HicB family RNase H-like nuclease|tara:strand:- start:1004 stop:1144 length:141 start_codon:yes stop_codon:yes gene_type:complete
MTKKETISIRLDPKLWKMSKMRALEADLKVGQFVEKALQKQLKKLK